MEENVALDTTKQKKFVKSIKGIKKLIKKKETEKPDEPVSPKPKDEKRKKKRPDRGLVYLSHIPHGFYEHEMTQYFKQFGMVTNARVIRSKRTGNSKGFAFVEFREPTVAEIVAETMNNYLMGKRLIKAAYIPPEKQRPKAMRKHWSRLNNPGKTARMQLKKAYNENKDEQGDLKKAKKILSNINKTKKKLSEMGINYDFFTPVDIPETLQDSSKNDNDSRNEIKNDTVQVEKTSKKGKKSQNADAKDTKESLKINKVEANKKVKQEKSKVNDGAVQQSILKIEEKKSNKSSKDSKKEKKKNVETPAPVVDKKEQKKKQRKLKDAGVNLPENFIKIQEGQDSDSSFEFDSDEYEKMLEDDSGDSDVDEEGVGDDSDGESSGDEDVQSEEEIVEPPVKKGKGKSVPVAVPQKQGKKQKDQIPDQNKRKVPQRSPVNTKKPKFEKQTQQPMKKQFKKKK